MNTNPIAYKKAAYPPPIHAPEHLSDEDVVYNLERTAKRSRAARKAQETTRQRRAEQAAAQEKEAGS